MLSGTPRSILPGPQRQILREYAQDDMSQMSLDASHSQHLPMPTPVIAPGHTFGTVTDKISAIVLTRRVGRGWMLGVAVTGMLVLVLTAAIAYLFARGVGIWGINIPVAWGF